MANSSQQSDIFLLTEKVDRLEKRLAVLENCLIKPAEGDGIVDLSQSRYKLFSDDGGDSVESELVTSKRGRPPLIPRAQLERQRDDLINFIEPRWPDLVKHMKRPKSLEHLLQTIKNVSPGAQTNWPYLQLTENISALAEFLRSGRYTGEPRQIAYLQSKQARSSCGKRLVPLA